MVNVADQRKIIKQHSQIVRSHAGQTFILAIVQANAKFN